MKRIIAMILVLVLMLAFASSAYAEKKSFLFQFTSSKGTGTSSAASKGDDEQIAYVTSGGAVAYEGTMEMYVVKNGKTAAQTVKKSFTSEKSQFTKKKFAYTTTGVAGNSYQLKGVLSKAELSAISGQWNP